MRVCRSAAAAPPAFSFPFHVSSRVSASFAMSPATVPPLAIAAAAATAPPPPPAASSLALLQPPLVPAHKVKPPTQGSKIDERKS